MISVTHPEPGPDDPSRMLDDPPAATPTVLCVDDDRALCSAFAEALRGRGYRVLTVHDGEAALEAVSRETPDLVLLDLLLPRRDGFAVLEAIRASQGPVAETPALLLSECSATETYAERAASLRAGGLLTKPLPLASLVEAVERTLGARAERPPRAGVAGSLEDLRLPALMARLHREAATGVLELRSGRKRKHVAFAAGEAVAVRSNLLNECFGNLLVRSGRISQAAMAESFERVKRGEGRQGEVLVAMEVLEHAELDWALQMQSDEKLFELFEWPKGQYRFHPRARLRGGSPVESGRGFANRLLEGVRTRTSAAHVAEWLARHGDRRLSRAREGVALDALDLAGDAEALAALDGRRTLAEAAGGDADFLRTCHALCLLGVLELGETVRPEPAPAPASQPQAAAPAARAAASFEQGLAELRAREFEAAAASFAECVRLMPEEGEYHVHMGWALYLHDPADDRSREVALLHMRKGAKLAPDREKPYLYLGRAYRDLGRTDLAQRLFTRASQNAPGSMEALRELRLLNLRRERKGLLRRLLRR